MSQHALEILTRTEFKNGIRDGIPESISIAHKFGYRRFDQPTSVGVTNELHDFGIVYATKKPYFLCVMTKGANPTHLSGFIQQVSKAVYENQNN